MRISKCFQIGRFEMFIGCPSIWPYAWSIDPCRYGYDIMLGRVQLIVCWLPSKRERARCRAERRAKWEAEMDAAELRRARTSWPARATP
jgi:hypothetical protein